MKSRTPLFAFIVAACITCFALYCAKQSPTSIQEKDFTGHITGYVFDKHHKPIKNVFVSINADSATPGVTDVQGFFTVGSVQQGTHVLHFTSPDFDDDSSYHVTLAIAEKVKLKDTVKLSSAYYIVAGKVEHNNSEVPAAGVSVVGYSMFTLAGPDGAFVLDRIRKDPIVKIMTAKTGIGFGTKTLDTLVPDDTNWANLSIDSTGASISGVVYDSSGKPLGNVVVAALGGGLVDTTRPDGSYTLKNVPCGEDVQIYVPGMSGLSGSVAGVEARNGSNVPGINITLKSVSSTSAGNGMAFTDNPGTIMMPDTVKQITLSVSATHDSNTIIASYQWKIIGHNDTLFDTTSVPYLTLSVAALEKISQTAQAKRSVVDPNLKSSAGALKKTGVQTTSTTLSVSVVALSRTGAKSLPEVFSLQIMSSVPTLSAGVDTLKTGPFSNSIPVAQYQNVWFSGQVFAPFSGIDSAAWSFDDNSVDKKVSDSFPVFSHQYTRTGAHYAVFRVMYGSNILRDTVHITVTSNTNIDTIDGTIAKDTVWNNQAIDYYIDDNLTINANVTWGKKIHVRINDGAIVTVNGNGKLSIQEGVAVTGGTGAVLEVGYSSSGTLIAQGSDSLPITFTNATDGSNWGSTAGGIVFYSATNVKSLLDHCNISNATTGINVQYANAVITNCSIRSNKNYGVEFTDIGSPKDTLSFVHDSITDNGDYPLVLYAEAMTKLPGETVLLRNANQGIHVFGGTVTKSGVWRKQAVPYIITDDQVDIENSSGVTINVQPGVVCKFDAGIYLEIGYSNAAAFIANGTAADSIVFTGSTDGSNWGYVDGTDPAGVWIGQYSTTKTSLSFCRIENATAGIYVRGTTLACSNCRIQNNKASGIIFDSDAGPQDSAHFLMNTIINNGGYAMEINASKLGGLSGTDSIAGNLGPNGTGDGIFVTADDITSGNYSWKKYTVPYIVDGAINISGSTVPQVTVRPGVKIELTANSYIAIGYSDPGKFIANGTAQDPISFTAKVAGSYWGYQSSSDAGGLRIDAAANSLTSITYCTITGATTGIWDAALATINHCIIQDNQDYGIHFTSAAIAANVDLTSLTFSNNPNGNSITDP
jgi:hypothetical protein